MRFEEILVILTGLSLLVVLADRLVLARQRAARGQTKPSGFVDFNRSIFPVLLLVFLLRSFVVEPFRIPSTSMLPTLLIGDFIVVNKYQYGLRLPITGTKFIKIGEPKRGDIIVFRHDNHQDLIKRIVGLPGDKINYRDKVLYINGKPTQLQNIGFTQVKADSATLYERIEGLNGRQHHLYINPQKPDLEYNFNDVTVPKGSYFVMGDNRDNSQDSRFYGFITEKKIIGRAFATFWSWDWSRDGFSVRWSRIAKKIV